MPPHQLKIDFPRGWSKVTAVARPDLPLLLFTVVWPPSAIHSSNVEELSFRLMPYFVAPLETIFCAALRSWARFAGGVVGSRPAFVNTARSEEHTSELQSLRHL